MRPMPRDTPKDELSAVVEQIEAVEPHKMAQGEESVQEVQSPVPRVPSQVSDLDASQYSVGSDFSSDVHANRRVMGAAATVVGATGALMLGPASGVALGAAALYCSTREDQAGTLARKVGSMYIQVTDRAVDAGLVAADEGVKKLSQATEKGCQRLSREVVDIASIPAPVRAGLCAVLNSQSGGHSQPRSSAEMLAEAKKIRDKYPDRVPIICERSPYCTGLPEISKKKFIVAGTMLCGEFKYMIHKLIVQATPGGEGSMKADQTIYIFCNGMAPKASTPMSELYDKMHGGDGFLYITYGAENTLG